MRTMLLTALACLIAIFAILAAAFRSYLQSFIVMTTIPFSVGAAFLGHIVLGYSLGFISFLGILALGGLVINGAQVLMMQTNEYVAQGMTRVDAIKKASVTRFRPIVLTSLTTTIGLSPLIFETSVQARFLIPMAISLSFGVLFSSFVVLLLVPSLYSLLLGKRGRLPQSLATQAAGAAD